MEKCGEKSALTMELHKCPVPPTLFINTMVVLESSKKNRERELEKKKRKKENESTS